MKPLIKSRRKSGKSKARRRQLKQGKMRTRRTRKNRLTKRHRKNRRIRFIGGNPKKKKGSGCFGSCSARQARQAAFRNNK